MKIHLTYDQKREIGVLIYQGEEEEAVHLIKKYAGCNDREAKEYVVSKRKHLTD